MFNFHENFCTCYLWPWFDPHMTTLQYIDDVMFHMMAPIGQNQRHCFVELPDVYGCLVFIFPTVSGRLSWPAISAVHTLMYRIVSYRIVYLRDKRSTRASGSWSASVRWAEGRVQVADVQFRVVLHQTYLGAGVQQLPICRCSRRPWTLTTVPLPPRTCTLALAVCRRLCKRTSNSHANITK